MKTFTSIVERLRVCRSSGV